jgi:hypothetical protein
MSPKTFFYGNKECIVKENKILLGDTICITKEKFLSDTMLSPREEKAYKKNLGRKQTKI